MTNDNIKVGDIYHMSWGYDQTNNTFFRVKEKRGKTQVVVQEVWLKRAEDSPCGPMSADYKYDPTQYEICKNSVFIKDNEKGKICKVKKSYWLDEPDPVFTVYNYHTCTKYKGQRVYESWYA